MPDLLRLICALCVPLFGAVVPAHAVVVQDGLGQNVQLGKPAQRIVSLLPALTESVCALGECQRLVGVDRYSNWPAQVKQLPQVGGGLDPSIERIVALKPDLVLMAHSARGAERLGALGLVVLRLEPQTHADVQAVLGTLARALGLPKARAQQVWQDIDAGMQRAATQLPAAVRGQRVYMEVSPAPYAASEASFIGQTMSRLGMRNIVPARLGTFPKINPEWVVRENPDVLVLGKSSQAALNQRPGWAQIGAVARGRVCAFQNEQADMLVRPGPRMAEAAHMLVRCFGQAQKAAP